MRIDPDRPLEVRINRHSDGATLTFPLLFFSADPTFVGRCTLQAVRIDDPLMDELGRAWDHPFEPDLLARLQPVLPTSDLTRAYDPASPVVLRVTRLVSPDHSLPRDSMGELVGGVYLETRLTDQRARAENCGPLTGPKPEVVTSYLIRIGSVRSPGAGAGRAASVFLVLFIGVSLLGRAF